MRRGEIGQAREAGVFLRAVAQEAVRCAPNFDLADRLGMYMCHDFRVNVGLLQIEKAVGALSEEARGQMRYTARILSGWLALTELAMVRAYEGRPGLEASELERGMRALTIGHIQDVIRLIETKWRIGGEERIGFGHNLDLAVTERVQRQLGIIPPHCL